jgi:hypothetical protein
MYGEYNLFSMYDQCFDLNNVPLSQLILND